MATGDELDSSEMTSSQRLTGCIWDPPPDKDHMYTDQPGDIYDTVIINVGGVRFEVLRSTFQRFPGSKLANIEKLTQHYRTDKNEYYFDRSAIAFEIVLNFYRLGELHPPTNVCSVLLKKELQYWGISDYLIEECCWLHYNSHMKKVKTLEKFKRTMDKGMKANTMGSNRCSSRWNNWQPKIWAFVDDYHSSLAAKIFAWISVTFVLISIFTFVAETHVSFRQNMTMEHYVDMKSTDAPQDAMSPGVFTTSPPTTATDGDTVTSSQNRGRRAIHHKSSTVGPTTSIGYVRGPRRKKRHSINEVTTSTPSQIVQNIDELLFAPNPAFETIDAVCYIFFTLEYLIRFIFCPSKRMFFRSGLNIVDTCALLIYYTEVTVAAICRSTREPPLQSFLEVIYVLRVVRIFRVFRMARHYRGLQILMYTLTASIREILLMEVFLSIGMLVFASLIYYTDMGAGTFDSIPHGFWWAIVTMTTVGYGDMVPSTNMGYLVGSLCALSGVLVISFTVPVIANNFSLFYQYIQYYKKKKRMETERAEWYERAVSCSIELPPELDMAHEQNRTAPHENLKSNGVNTNTCRPTQKLASNPQGEPLPSSLV